MPLHLIAYELTTPSQDAGPLTATIKSIGPWARALESQWLLISPKSQTELVDILSPHIASTDRLIVATVEPSHWMARNLPEHVVRWLNSCARLLAGGRQRSAARTSC